MKARRLCLDAGLFIALQRPEQHTPEELTSIRTLLEDIDSGKVYAVLSSLIESELLDGSLDIIEPRCDGKRRMPISAPV